MQTTAHTQKSRTREAEQRSAGVEKVATGLSQAGLIIIAVLAGLIGIWGLVCMVSGLAQSNGVSALIRAYVRAVTGG